MLLELELGFAAGVACAARVPAISEPSSTLAASENFRIIPFLLEGTSLTPTITYVMAGRKAISVPGEGERKDRIDARLSG